jgi:hypothetical protein
MDDEDEFVDAVDGRENEDEEDSIHDGDAGEIEDDDGGFGDDDFGDFGNFAEQQESEEEDEDQKDYDPEVEETTRRAEQMRLQEHAATMQPSIDTSTPLIVPSYSF